MRSILFDITSYIYLIPLFLGLSKYPFLSNNEKKFFLFIIASAFCSVLAYFTSSIGNNIYVVYLFNLLEILLLPIFLLDVKDKQKFKWIWVIGVAIGLGLILFEALMRDGGVTKFNNFSLTYAAIVLSILSVRNLLKLRFDPSIFDLSKSSLFWFTMGLGIYYLGNILIFAFTRIFQEQNPEILGNLTYFRLLIIYISVFLYTWGFLIIKTKTNNGTLAGKSK